MRQYLVRCAAPTFRQLYWNVIAKRVFSESRTDHTMEESHDLFEYTSGRWLWNEEQRRSERRRRFNIPELKNLAAAAIHRDPNDIIRFEKLGEGGFNRTFLLSLHDGFQLVARIPYPVTEPKHLLIGSEVATLEYLRSHNIPVPKVYGYSTTSNNPAGTEYIFMELVRGTNLGDIWFELSETARTALVGKIVALESRLFSLNFPANGSLYYRRDLEEGQDKIKIPSDAFSENGSFCIGPDLTLAMWYGKRLTLDSFRGPYRNTIEVLLSGAQKEKAYLAKYGKPLHPLLRTRRECVGYERQCPRYHMDHLERYLHIAPHLTAQLSDNAARPTIRHPDLQPNNVFVSESLEITGLIDWQHCAILPLFIQGGIPSSLQNYGDDVSESLEVPRLPETFDNESETEQFKQVLLLRKRQLHYNYVTKTMEAGSLHSEVLMDDLCILRRKLFRHASDPWEGDNVTLKVDLIELIRKLPTFDLSILSESQPNFLIEFPENETLETLRLAAAMEEADCQFQACLNLVGVGPEGWVPVEQYNDAKQREQQLKADTLEEAETEQERRLICEHWIFDDFDEAEYS
nr:altered inheritance of mitochondria protein 9, mitochondrial [Quercus suber]